MRFSCFSCEDLVATFQCNCLSGFGGDLCDLDIDECVSEPCLNGGACLNLVGEFQCNCASGFSGRVGFSFIWSCVPSRYGL